MQAYYCRNPNTVHLWTSIIRSISKNKMVLFFFTCNGMRQEYCCQWEINIHIYVTVLQFAFTI
jgi:hypothetical protein